MVSTSLESLMMMKNYKIVLQYEGTKYQGWQRQESTGNTIQGKLEALLTKMCDGISVEVQGSGRTDAGVHAYGQIANFHAETTMEETDIMEYLNRYLPEDIAVISLCVVPDRFHSRLNVKGKTYRYRVYNSNIPNVFERRYTLAVAYPLNMEKMKEAAKYLIGTYDFKAFTSNKKGNKSTVRTIKEIQIEQKGEEIRYTFHGDGFLYHMIRIIMGTLLEVGRGERQPEEIKKILESKNREQAGILVPAQGLALMDVQY